MGFFVFYGRGRTTQLPTGTGRPPLPAAPVPGRLQNLPKPETVFTAYTRIGDRPVQVMHFSDTTKDRCYGFTRGNCWASHNERGEPVLQVDTTFGEMGAEFGDYVVQSAEGLFFVFSPAQFNTLFSRWVMPNGIWEERE